MSVALVSDTCHYLPADLAAQHGITSVSLYVQRNGGAARESAIHDYGSYFESLTTAAELPTTSQPSIGDFLAVYEPLLQAGHEVLSIHLSGGLSGTVRAAEQARAQLGEAAFRVTVVDSATACGAQGLMLMAAAAAIRAGGDAAQAAARAHQAQDRLGFLFALDSLEYLRRGGRIGGAQAWIGSALQIKPILSVKSEVTAVERVRTTRRAFERLVRLMHELKDAGCDAWVIQHTRAPEQAALLVQRGREVFETEPLFVSEIGPVIGTHIGPGLLGVGAVPSSLLA
ncbi:MAG: DegV family protein [Solirubrobacteraceae bacterium]